jgi:hypothetical protein
MRNAKTAIIKFFVCLVTLLVSNVYAQESTSTETTSDKTLGSNKESAVDKDVKPKVWEKNTKSNGNQSERKMVQDATISLQTTITGNQEQPRVLYILPWQSPTTTNVDFESLDNEQKAVFGHVERDELRRELESSDVIQ